MLMAVIGGIVLGMVTTIVASWALFTAWRRSEARQEIERRQRLSRIFQREGDGL